MEPGLEYVFQITCVIGDRRRFGSSGYGERGFGHLVSGEIEGPRLQGRVIPYSGADYHHRRSDGVIEMDAHYLLEASDGTVIKVANRGYRHGPREVLDAAMTEGGVDPSLYYMRLAPTFAVEPGPHDWLTRTVFIGTGDRRPDRTIFRYYAVT